MKPQFVDIIVAIADCGSLGAAARKLGKSQPAITGALRSAEKELGERIFDRVPHGVIATVLGQTIIERCRRISNELKRLDEDVAQRKGDLVGTLSIVAATSVVSVRILPQTLKQYRRKYPNIRISVTAERTSHGFQSLLSGEADFVVGPLPDQTQTGGLHSVPLFDTPIVIVTGAQSKFAKEGDPKKLAKANWLVNGPVERRPKYFGLFEAHGITPPDPVVSSESIVSILSMIEGTDDLCCIAHEVVDHLRGVNEFAIVPVGDQLGEAKIGLMSAIDRPQTRAATLFSDLIRQNSVNFAPKA